MGVKHLNRLVKKKQFVAVKLKRRLKKKRASKYDEKVTLAPLTFEEAMEKAVKFDKDGDKRETKGEKEKE